MQGDTIYDRKLDGIDGGEIDLADFRGRKMLIVNTASRCGFTAQYAQLQELHEHFSDKVAVIGCPSNDFGEQEPGSESEIAEFCETTFGIAFPMSRKLRVKGPGRHPLFDWLVEQSPDGEEPVWNFTKFVVDEQGRLTHKFGPTDEPLSDAVVSALDIELHA